MPTPCWSRCGPELLPADLERNARNVARRVDSMEIRNRFSPLEDAVDVTVGTADAISGSDIESEEALEWLHRVAAQIVDPVQLHEHNVTTSHAVILQPISPAH